MTSFTRFIQRALALSTVLAGATLPATASAGLQPTFQFPAPAAVSTGSQVAVVPLAFRAAGTIATVRVLTQGKPAADFTAAPGGTCTVGQAFSAGQTCLQPIQFAPQAPGERRGSVLLLDSNGVLLASQLLDAIATGSAGIFLSGTMRTVAGNGTWVYKQDGVPATNASIFLPGGVAIDGSGNIFLSDTSNNRVRRVDLASGLIATVAGSGSPGFSGDNGPATLAGVNLPSGMVIDGAGDILFADSGNHAIRRLSLATGILSTIAGQLGQYGASGDNGLATAATLNTPEGLALDAAGNLFIADTNNHLIRRVDAATGIITTVAGLNAAASSGDGGPATAAYLNSPWSVSLDLAGNLFIADLGNNKIRKIDTAGTISTVAGTGNPTYNGDSQAATTANLKGPAAVLPDVAGNLYIADSGNNLIRKVSATTGLISLVAGSGSAVFDGDGAKASDAGIYGPYALALDISGNVFFSDIFHHRIREVQNSLSLLKFLPIQVGRTSLANLVQFENDGNAPLNFSSLAPDRNAAIDPGTTTCSPSTPLAVNAPCTIGAQFAPQVTGMDVTAEIDLNSDASNTPGVILLDGEVDALDPTTTTLISSANPAALGAPITFTATVAGGSSPTGSVRFYDGNTLLGTVTLHSGMAAFTTSSLALGTHPLTANYTGDAASSPSTSSILNQIVKQSATLTLASSVNPSQVGAAVTFTATIATSAISPTGSIVFSDGGSAIGNGSINSSGTATFTTSALVAGTHPITATFAGDANTLPGTSSPVSQAVSRWPTTTTLTATPSTSAIGDPVTFSLHVAITSTTPATGAVQLTDGSILLTTLALDPQGNAAYTTSSLPVGTHTLVAHLQSDATNDASTSAPLTETVATIATTTALTSSANPATAGATLHLTAQVAAASTNSAAGPLTGTVTFSEGATTLGSATLNGSATATLDLTTFPVGTHTLVANYAGDQNHAPSTSAPFTQTVANAATTVQLVSSANPSTAGRGITLTAVVSGNGGIPTGTVTFLDGATTLGTAPVNSAGQATFSVSTLSAGTHPLTASYAGDARDAASTSAPYSQVVQQTVTALALTSSVNPAYAGAAITFVASLTSNGSLPTGQVTFSEGPTVLGASALSPTGAATFTTSTLPAGSHTVTATFAGDTDHAASASAPLVQVVQMGTSSVALAASANPALTGAPVTFSITVSGTAARPTGTVTLMDAATPLATLTLTSAGTATFTTSTLTLGDHPLTAVYSGDTTHAGSTSNLVTERIQQTTATILASSLNPSIVGDTVTLTATLTGSTGALLTGSVTFSDASTTLGTSPLSNGAATFSTATLTAGTHLLLATYSGDPTNQPSTSAPLSQAVNTAGTSVTLTSSANPSVTGSSVTFSATVVSAGKVPTGTVTFLDGAATLGTGTIAQSTTTFTTGALTAGQHAIVARYNGDAGTQLSTSAALIQVTQQRTTLTLASSVNPALTVQGIVLTAQVANGANATGVVTFTDGSTSLGSSSLNAAGAATLTLPALAAGSHILAATYAGDPNNLPSLAPTFTETVQLRPTATSMTSSSDTYLSGQQITLVAVIRSSGPIPPTGTVTFASAGAPLGAAPLSADGVATLTLAPVLPAYSIVATYTGDPVYTASTSAPYPIKAGPSTTFTMTPSWTKNSLSTGTHTAVDLAFLSVKGFNDTLALGCLELPLDATCTFSTDKFALGANAANTVHLTIDTANPLGAGATARLSRPASASRITLAILLPGVAFFGLLFTRRRRRMPWLLPVLALCTLGAGITGCANELVQASTPPGSYTIRILASGTQSGASQVVDLALTVTQ